MLLRMSFAALHTYIMYGEITPTTASSSDAGTRRDGHLASSWTRKTAHRHTRQPRATVFVSSQLADLRPLVGDSSIFGAEDAYIRCPSGWRVIGTVT